MAIQELNVVEINEVAGALNLGNGALNPLNGLTNTLTNLNLETQIPLTIAAIVGLLANPGVIFQAIDVGGIFGVVSALPTQEVSPLLGGLAL